MTDNVRKIFDILGVEPNEEFKVEGLGNLCIDSNLNLYTVLPAPTRNMKVNNKLILDIIKGEYIITKSSKESKKKKLRDFTLEDYKRWRCNNCARAILSCEECIFDCVNCDNNSKKCWVNNKDLYSDKFLDQELEVEE